MSDKKDLIIVGAGGMGREVLQWVKDINAVKPTWNIKGFIDDNPNALDGKECDYGVIGSIRDWQVSDNERFALGIGVPAIKAKVVSELKARGAKFVIVIHPSAVISDYAKIGEGTVIYPYSSVAVNTKVEDYVVINSHTSLGHDTEIGKYTTISAHCDVTGGSTVCDAVFIGTNSSIVPKLNIGKGAYICAGSIVMTNIKTGQKVLGNPAKRFEI